MNQKVTLENNLTFELVKDDFTAQLVYSPRAKFNICVPKSIIYQSHEYLVTKIKQGSFENNISVKKLEFPEDSSLFLIEKNSFRNSSIESIYIPEKLEELQDGWCHKTKELKTVIISPKNRNFKYLDETHQIIIGKSDKTSDIFDTIIFSSRNIESVNIPSYIKHIQSFSFEYCQSLTSIQFSEKSELKTIGQKVYSNSSITNIIIPPTVEKIEEGFFFKIPKFCQILISPQNRFYKYLDEERKIIIGKSDKNGKNFDVILYAKNDVKTIAIPSTIKRISNYAFYNCKYLYLIEIPNSELRSIGKKCFFNSLIESLFIPRNLKELDEGWCSLTYNLKSIEISPENRYFKYIEESHQLIAGKSDNDNFDVLKFVCRSIDKEVTIPSNIKHIDSFAFQFCEKLKTIKIQSDSKLQSIGEFGFSNVNIERFTIAKNIEKIGKYAFFQCENLEEVEIEEGSKLKSFTVSLFNECEKLRSIQISEDSKIEAIEEESLNFCQINYLFIPSSVKTIKENWNIYLDSIEKIEISPKNKYFKFADEDNQIIVGKSDNEVYDTLIYSNHWIENVKIPNYIKYINSYSFQNRSNLRTIEISEDSELRSIGAESFYDSLIESIYIPEKLEELQDGWCQKTKELKTVIISPKNRNFKYLDETHQIIIGKSDKTSDIFDTIVFSSRNIESVNIPSYIKHIESFSFEYCQSLTSIQFSEESELKTIGQSAFAYTYFKSIAIPKSVEKIGKMIFYFCGYLEQVEIEKESKIKSIEYNSFAFCSDLKELKFNDDSKIQTINNCAFIYSSIETFHIPTSVQFLQDDWCKNTEFLKDVTISSQNKNFKFLDDTNQLIVCKSNICSANYDSLSFTNRSIEKVTIPSFIKYIAASCFLDCINLESVEFDENSQLEIIEDWAFQSTKIKRFVIPENVIEIGYHIFNNCKYLKSIEILSNSLFVCFDLFDCIDGEMLISFPNVRIIEINNIFKERYIGNFIIFIRAGAHLI